MASIQGSKVVFQVLIGDDYKTVICAKSINIRTQADTKEITTKGDGRFKDFDYDQLTASVTLDTIVMMQNPNNPVHFDFWDWQYQFMEINFRIIFTDSLNTSLVKVFRAQGIIPDTATNASAAQIVDSNTTILVKGQWFLEDAVPEYSDFRILVFNNDAAAAQFRVQLLDPNTDDVIFDTSVKPQANGGYLDNPFDFTFKVLKGIWYWIIETRTETENNDWVLSPPPNYTASFQNGVTVYNSKIDANNTADFSNNRELAFQLGTVVQPPACVPPAKVGFPELPDGEVGTPYSYSFPITGTAPFSLSDVTKPSWMNINIVETSPGSGSYLVQYSGTPDTTTTDENVIISVNNACGGFGFTDAISITAPVVSPGTINYSFDEEGAANGTFRLYKNGVQVVFLTADNSGSLSANPGDDMEVIVAATTDGVANVEVDDNGSSIYFDNIPWPGTNSFTWTVISGHTYDVITSISA